MVMKATQQSRAIFLVACLTTQFPDQRTVWQVPARSGRGRRHSTTVRHLPSRG